MNSDRYPGKVRMKSAQGFTLIELMIVMVIAGILATSVVFMFVNPSAKVKSQAFTMLGDMNMARAEAVSRNQDVLVDFITGGPQEGYVICVDAAPPNDSCTGEADENVIRVTFFGKGVEYYAPTVLPDRGPGTTPGGGDLIGKNGIVVDDGTIITGFTMEPDGTLDDAIAAAINLVIFVPKKNQSAIDGTPYAVTISSSSGRVRISRWMMGGSWNTK